VLHETGEVTESEIDHLDTLVCSKTNNFGGTEFLHILPLSGLAHVDEHLTTYAQFSVRPIDVTRNASLAGVD
jgi:hypothetical protein